MLARAAARALRASIAIDRAYRFFDQLRSNVVLAAGSDTLLNEYNALAYGRTAAYHAGCAEFRRGLFDWEVEAIDRYFPAAPARLLIGGAGGGREAYALLERGYEVTAFDPAEPLVQSMAGSGRRGLRAYCGDYGGMPYVIDSAGGKRVDLREQAPFDGGIMGWASLSHLRTDTERIGALRSFAALTDGPVLCSYFQAAGSEAGVPRRGILGALRRRAARRGRSVFSVHIGYYRLFTPDEVERLVHEAGLTVLVSRDDGNFPYVVVRR